MVTRGKESACNAGDTGEAGLIRGLGRSLGEGNGNPLGNPMDRGAWRVKVVKVTKDTETTEYACIY